MVRELEAADDGGVVIGRRRRACGENIPNRFDVRASDDGWPLVKR